MRSKRVLHLLTAAAVAMEPMPQMVVFDLDYTIWPFWVDTHVRPPFRPHPSLNTAALDADGQEMRPFADIHRVMADLQARGVKIGVASRTSAPEEARSLMALLHLPGCTPLAHHAGHGAAGAAGRGMLQAVDAQGPADSAVHARHMHTGFSSGAGALPVPPHGAPLASVVHHAEIYPSDKQRHFKALSADSGVKYEDMVFFDDERRNIVSVGGGLGVHAVHVDEEVGVTWAVYQRALQDWRGKRTGGTKTKK